MSNKLLKSKLREIYDIIWNAKLNQGSRIMGFSIHKWTGKNDPFFDLLGSYNTILFKKPTWKFLFFQQYIHFTITESRGKLKWSRNWNLLNADVFLYYSKNIYRKMVERAVKKSKNN